MFEATHLILKPREIKTVGTLILGALIGLLTSCISVSPRVPGIGAAVPWSGLPGWDKDQMSQAWPALLNSCQKLPARSESWKQICADTTLFPDPDDETARAFFETRFIAHEVNGDNSTGDGLITGYYEPLLQGSMVRTERYQYPVYRRPDDLVIVDLGKLYPELEGRRYRGRLVGDRVVPYYSRAEISSVPSGGNPSGSQTLSGQELLWVDDPVSLFFLEIQGSGRVQLPDGRMLYVSYADQNGHPYVAIGRTLISSGALTPEEVTLPGIRDWLATHPDQIREILNSNPSYVFFRLRDPETPGPVGALNVPLQPQRSIAVDPAYIPLGSPVWLDTQLPEKTDPVQFRRLQFAQDTGGAIRGPGRADLFFGFGQDAERLAGAMRERGKLYVLLPSK